jgi:hypothetical protein
MDSDWVFDVCHGSTAVPHDIGAVGVIDGSKFIGAFIIKQVI